MGVRYEPLTTFINEAFHPTLLNGDQPIGFCNYCKANLYKLQRGEILGQTMAEQFNQRE